MREYLKKYKFRDISFKNVIFEDGKVTIEYLHFYYEKKLIFENVKEARTQTFTLVYYCSLLDKMGKSEEGEFTRIVNRAPKYNEIYIVNSDFTRVMLKFNDNSRYFK